jgi:hypothetical protein
MPEGHTSPQGRFATDAELVDGRVLESTDAHGKHLFHHYGPDLVVHVHLGLHGRFGSRTLPAAEPRGHDPDRAGDAPRAEPLLVPALSGRPGRRAGGASRKSTDPPGKSLSGRVGWKGRFSPTVARVRHRIPTRPE